MIPMPLTGPDGVTYAHRCGNCGNVFGALTVPNDDAGLYRAERCCTCLSCGSPAGLARAYCALCDKKKREEWEDRQRQREENRARNLAASPNPNAALELEHVMSCFSENNWSAGWLVGWLPADPSASNSKGRFRGWSASVVDVQEATVTKNSALAAFRRDVLPHVKETYERDGRVDTPARCEAWNDYVDALQKSGLITEQQASTWTNPF